MKHIALLRAINLAGVNKVGMADLRDLLAGLGFPDAKTLLNSGNIVFDGGNKTTAALEQAFQARKLPIPRIRITTFSLQLRMHLLARGNFLTAMPRSLLRLDAGGIRLKALPVELPIRSFPVAIVTLKNCTPSPVVQLFLERLCTFARENGFT